MAPDDLLGLGDDSPPEKLEPDVARTTTHGKDTFRITSPLVGGPGAKGDVGGTDPVTVRVTWTNP